MVANFTGGMPLGHIFEACIMPLRPLADISYHFYLHNEEVNQLKKNGLIPKGVANSKVRILH